MTDEAHRSQYDVLALNMRNALPNAAFPGLHRHPPDGRRGENRQVFGDYVSVYNFKASVDDQATVPLYYENRIPELQLTNPNLNAGMAELLDEAMLDEDQERAWNASSNANTTSSPAMTAWKRSPRISWCIFSAAGTRARAWSSPLTKPPR